MAGTSAPTGAPWSVVLVSPTFGVDALDLSVCFAAAVLGSLPELAVLSFGWLLEALPVFVEDKGSKASGTVGVAFISFLLPAGLVFSSPLAT